ncbi:MAG: response regulator [Deltaproteobacteria bacterium]|nr:response regulator [Deltaproteobacteria bacterium]
MDTVKPRVLLADDESHIRSLMKAVIKTLGYDVIAEAVNGSEAVDLCVKEKPDLLLMDINMPVKTGIEALKEIVSLCPKTCVIMLSSVSDMESVQEAIEAGATHFIRKDTPITEMKTIITEAWDDYKSS